MSKENPVMKMYEAQAIAIEKQMKIEQLELEKQDLMEKLKKSEEEKEKKIEESCVRYLAPVMNSINLKLSQQFVSLEAKINTNILRLEQKIEENLMKACQSSSNSGKQDIKEQPKSLTYTILVIGWTSKPSVVLSGDRSTWIGVDIDLPCGMCGSGAVCLNGEIYLCGVGEESKSLYKLDKNKKWKRLADMNVQRDWIANSCFAWNGYIWVLGGEDEDGESLKSVERYDRKTDKWTVISNMRYPRASAAAVVWNDRIIISGGNDSYGSQTNAVECFNLGRWMKLPRPPAHLSGHSLVSYKRKLVLLGGDDENCDVNDNVWGMDPHELNANWKKLPPVKTRYSDFVGVVLDGKIYAIGGRMDREVGDLVEVFDGQHWRDGPPLPHELGLTIAVIIPQTLADHLCSTSSK